MEQQKLSNRNKKKNNCMHISSNKTSEISHEKTWTWLQNGNIKRETETLPIAEGKNAIKIDYIKEKSINASE